MVRFDHPLTAAEFAHRLSVQFALLNRAIYFRVDAVLLS